MKKPDYFSLFKVFKKNYSMQLNCVIIRFEIKKLNLF